MLQAWEFCEKCKICVESTTIIKIIEHKFYLCTFCNADFKQKNNILKYSVLEHCSAGCNTRILRSPVCHDKSEKIPQE